MTAEYVNTVNNGMKYNAKQPPHVHMVEKTCPRATRTHTAALISASVV